MAAPRKYAQEIRDRAVRLARESDLPLPQIARDLGVYVRAAHPRRTGGHLLRPGAQHRRVAATAAADRRGRVYVIADNLSSHTSVKVRGWLARHPRIPTSTCPAARP